MVLKQSEELLKHKTKEERNNKAVIKNCVNETQVQVFLKSKCSRWLVNAKLFRH